MTTDDEAEVADNYNNAVDRRGCKLSFSSTEDWRHNKFTQTLTLYMTLALAVGRCET